MPVYNYNVESRLKKYEVKDPADVIFTEKMPTKDAPRPEWAKLMLFAQKEKMLNRKRLYPQPVFIKIESLAAMQCQSEEQFQHFVGEAISHNATIYSLKEEAVFNKEYPKGISNDPEKLAKAKSIWQMQPERKSHKIIEI